MNGTRTISGHSMPINVLFVLLNLTGLTFTTIGFHANFTDFKLLFVCIGIGLLLLSTVGLILLKGRLMIATVSRVLVGGLFIVSGLIKANDPVGFSYKLEEYFEDGALAFRIKDWFGAPGFSLEFLIQWALVISVVICIAEIVLGVLVLIGGKMKLMSWLLMIMMVFFTFLTWHTSNCDNTKKFTDRDTYQVGSSMAQVKLQESKTDKSIKIISKTSTEIVVDELRSPQCVSDCGCFGDAMKGSVGRSLTPSESYWKDIVLLYLVTWIFAAQRILQPNSVRQNWIIIPITMLIIAFFCWVFDWYFPLLFGSISIISALWLYRSGGRLLGNHYGSALIVTFWCSFFVWYVLKYDPLKDYRPYAVGSNLVQKTKDGDNGIIINTMIYRNIKTGKTRKYDASSKAYTDSKIWEQTATWKYDTMIEEVIRPMRLASITEQFNPFLNLEDITQYERSLPTVEKQLKQTKVTGLRLTEIASGSRIEIPQIEYNVESYPVEEYTVLDTIEVNNPDFTEVNIRDLIFTGDQVLVIVTKKLDQMDKNAIPELKRLQKAAETAGVQVVFITNADAASIRNFRKKYGFNVPTFINDETELKAISRSNPCLMVMKKGVVVGKYTYHSMPTFDWIQKNLFSKK